MAGLLDFLQSASNAAAGNVSGPVDILAWGLRKAGVPVPSDPVLGAEWMRRNGLTKDVPQSATQILGETAGLLAPFAAASRLATSARGLLDAGADGVSASRSTSIYDPKPKAPRAFEADYPTSPAPTGSVLTRDMDGLPINPNALVVGRRVSGGADVGTSTADIKRILDSLDISTSYVERGSKNLSKSDFGKYDSPNNAVYIDKALSPPVSDRVLAHELGHAIDHRSTSIAGGSLEGVANAAKQVYSDLNTSGWVSNWRKGSKPQDFGYKLDNVRAENMAEAIRAYLQDPNYIKTVAPELAARIRQIVNTSKISDRVHFNSLAPVAGGGLLSDDYFGSK